MLLNVTLTSFYSKLDYRPGYFKDKEAATDPSSSPLMFVLVSLQENQALQKSNEELRRKLKEAQREVEILKTLLKRQALHTVEEDSSS